MYEAQEPQDLSPAVLPFLKPKPNKYIKAILPGDTRKLCCFDKKQETKGRGFWNLILGKTRKWKKFIEVGNNHRQLKQIYSVISKTDISIRFIFLSIFIRQHPTMILRDHLQNAFLFWKIFSRSQTYHAMPGSPQPRVTLHDISITNRPLFIFKVLYLSPHQFLFL